MGTDGWINFLSQHSNTAILHYSRQIVNHSMGEKGLIFDIQRFSVHDGPGIRTTVFMKGCPLKCLWCSNPESQDPFPTLMVRDKNCRACGACVEACPRGAILLNHGTGRSIDWKKCDQCLTCVAACIYHALNICGTNMDVSAVLEEVLKDEAFYQNSGGGITVSGGEALSQASFTADMLEACVREKLHTALDTSGHVPWESLERVLPFVDLLLWDIKHLDSRAHEKAAGVGNGLILENLEKAAQSRTKIWLRIPLIAGFNDSPDHIRDLAALGKRMGAEKVSLLPYHDGGSSKCRQMGRPYPFADGRRPDDEHVEKLKRMIEDAGLAVSVGN